MPRSLEAWKNFQFKFLILRCCLKLRFVALNKFYQLNTFFSFDSWTFILNFSNPIKMPDFFGDEIFEILQFY